MTSRRKQLLRYLLNGIAATLVHYLILYSCLELFGLRSAGVANVIAAIFGISASFVGNRYFVFPGQKLSFLTQATKFAGLYMFIATINGLILFVWTDALGFAYTPGFLIGVVVQILIGYVGARKHVFVPTERIGAVGESIKAAAED